VAKTGFPIVGIGASAGGIEALTRLFGAMPADGGIAFVVVLHLDPTHESQLAEILGRHTDLAVVEITDGMRLEPDRVHVIVPDAYVTVSHGRLRLTEPTEPRGHRHPVDILFASLADDQRDRTICIVLSGTGSNGTHGLKDVQAQGGCALVQDPETARFDGMPRSAIGAGLADQVLAPEKMPEFLLHYVRHDYVAAPAAIDRATADGQAELDPILALLRVRSGHDFRHYKRSTLLRRVHRRMGLNRVEAMPDYVDLLRTSPAEIEALVKDLMISVTGFFRDAEAWRTLDETVLAPLVAHRDSGASARIWVPACASGEEAYSLAMLVAERAEAAQKNFNLKVFATDSQESNLNVARSGVYPEAAAAAIPPDRLRRFFNKLDGTYEVKKELRDLVVFAPQNLLRDPPFSRMDLIACRNLLIYLEPEAQNRVLALFHFALREGGHLFLGNAESTGRQDELFEATSKKWRIYRRLGPTRHDIVDFPLFPGKARHLGDALRPEEPEHAVTGPPARIAEVARRVLIERYAPASVLIDRKGRALYFHGPTGDYLEPPTGEPTRDLLALAREGLRAKLRVAVRQAAAENQSTSFSARVRQGAALRAVAVTVAPVTASREPGQEAAGLLLVSFEPAQEPTSAPAVRPDDEEESLTERALADELKATRAELQSTAEQMDSANEELKASNEEVTSMNEELQSTNEELETSKEELQSYNEELHTINNQLQHKIQDLEDTTNNLNNLLSGTEIATVFLDTDFRIRWFSPASKDLLDLVASDIGRPVGSFALKVADQNLLRDAETVLAKLTGTEAEVRSDTGQWYLRRMVPYRTQDNRIAGVVVTFTDVTERKRATDAIDEARVYAEAIIETVRQPLLVLDRDLRVRSANQAFYNAFRSTPNDAEGRLLYDLDEGAWDIPELRRLLTEILPRNEQLADFEVGHDFQNLGPRSMLLNARKLSRENGRQELILLAIEDVTDRKQGEDALRESEERYRTLFEAMDEGFCIIEAVAGEDGGPGDYRYVVANPAFEAETGVSGVVGKTIREAFPGEAQEWFDTYDAVLRTGEPIRFERSLVTQKRDLELYAFRLDDEAQRRVAVVFRDITERKQAYAHRDVLIGELSHRVKNTLATVQSLSSQTVRQSASLDAFKAAFDGRLHALARAHDLLVEEDWAGTEIGQLARRTLEPHGLQDGGGIALEGPRLVLRPQAGVALVMILHELATNAAKYGALSAPDGRLDLTWRLDDGEDRPQVRLHWIETDGPRVERPSREGFGTRLIQRSAAYELQGDAQLDFRADGLRCEVTFPWGDAPHGRDSALVEHDTAS